METYIYIIAPKNENNLTVLLQFISLYPELVEEERLKTIFKKDEKDVLHPEGQPLIYAGGEYYLVKALQADFNPSMLDNVIDPEIYTLENLPFDIYWL